MHVVHTQCKVLYVSNYPNPSFSPFVEVCCSIIGGFKLLVHPGYDIFELLSIFTFLYPFSPACHLVRIEKSQRNSQQPSSGLPKIERDPHPVLGGATQGILAL